MKKHDTYRNNGIDCLPVSQGLENETTVYNNRKGKNENK